MTPFSKRASIALFCVSSLSAMEAEEQENTPKSEGPSCIQRNIFWEIIVDGDSDLLQEYLEIDKELVYKEIDGVLPLYSAIQYKQVESAKILCDMWPQSLLLVNSKQQKSTLSLAAENGFYDFIVYVFEKHRVIFTDEALHDFIWTFGNIELIKCIFDGKVSKLNKDDCFVKKIIDSVSFNMQADVVKYLIKYDRAFKDCILKHYLNFFDYDMIRPNDDWSLENLVKQDFACLSLVNFMNEFDLDETHEAIQSSKFNIEFNRKYNENRYRLRSNHRILINYKGEGNQGAGVKVIVWDSFLTPPQGSGQILYSSRMDHKIPADFRKSLSEKGLIERNLDDGSHGIQVTGLIADDDFGIAPNAQIIPVSKDGIVFQEPEEITDYILRENYGAKIINMSFGNDDPIKINSIYIPILKILCRTHIVVKSAGNDARVLSKGFHQAIKEDEALQKHLFVVADVMPDGKTLSEASCYFSERGFSDDFVESVGIAAPGTNIISTVPEYNIQQFDFASGTSMAAGIVSGAIAKLMSDFPDFSLTEISDLVRAGANKEGIFADRGKYGQGFLNLEQTYKLARGYRGYIGGVNKSLSR